MTTSHSQKHNYVIIELHHSSTHTWAFIVPTRQKNIYYDYNLFSNIISFTAIIVPSTIAAAISIVFDMHCRMLKNMNFHPVFPTVSPLLLLHSLPWYSFVYFSHAFVFLFISLCFCYRAVFYEKMSLHAWKNHFLLKLI